MRNLLFIFLFISFSSFSQEKYKLLAKIAAEADFFTTDNQCNVYAVRDNELVKFDKTGKQLYKYSNKNLGKITQVDASNMLRVLVYYKDFSQVVFLDNTLTQNGDPVNMMALDLSQVPVVCSSYDNGMWVYDQSRFALVRYDKTLTDIRETGNLNQLLNDSLQPVQMMEYNNRLYVNNPASGIMIFDIYGVYYKTIPVKGASSFQPIGEWVYYAAGKKIKAYEIRTTEEKEFEVPADFSSFRLETDILVLQGEKVLSLYSAR